MEEKIDECQVRIGEYELLANRIKTARDDKEIQRLLIENQYVIGAALFVAGRALSSPTPKDDPELDGTDGAHPAWWRGHGHGAEGVTKAMLEAFSRPRHNGRFSSPAMNELRGKIWDMRDKLAELQSKVDRMNGLVSPESYLGKILKGE